MQGTTLQIIKKNKKNKICRIRYLALILLIIYSVGDYHAALADCNSVPYPQEIIILSVDASFSMNYAKENICLNHIMARIASQRQGITDILLFGQRAKVLFSGVCRNDQNGIVEQIMSQIHKLAGSFRNQTDILCALNQINSQIARDKLMYKGVTHYSVIIVSDLLDNPFGNVPSHVPADRLSLISIALSNIARQVDKIFIVQADPEVIAQYQPYLSILLQKRKLVIEPSDISPDNVCSRIDFLDFWTMPRIDL